MKKKKNSIAKNYICNLIYQMLTILLPLITTPYLSRVLGAEAIGIYGYTTSIVSYFLLFGNFGIAMYGQREIASRNHNKEECSRAFYELMIIRTITLTISMILFYITFKTNRYSLYYLILLIEIVANMFDISWLFQGYEEFDKLVIRNLIVKIICLILIFTCIKNENDLWIYFIVYSGANLIGNLSLWFYLPKYLTKLNNKKLNLKKHIFPMILLFLPQIAIQIYTVLDKTMIGLITKNMSEVGYYEQGQKIVRAALMVVCALQTVMNSKIASAYAQKDKKTIRECLDKSFKFVWFLAIGMLFGIIGISKGLVGWYYGPGFESVQWIIIFTSPIILSIGLSGITGTEYLIHTNKTKEFTISVIFGCIINILINLLLINRMASVGAAIGSVIAETSIFLFQLKYIKMEYNIKTIFSYAVKPIIAGIIMLISIITLNKFTTVSMFSTLYSILIGALIYIYILYILKYQFLLDIINQMLLFLKNKFKNRN